MRRFALTKSRLSDLESARGASTIILRFADGSTRSVKIAKDFQLRLLLDAFAKARAFPPQPPEGQSAPPPPEPTTSSDELLELMSRALSVEGDRLFQTIFGVCQSIEENKEKK